MFWVPRVGTRLVCKNELRHNKINTPLIICMLSKSCCAVSYWHPLNREVLLGLLFRLCLWRHRPSVVMLVIIIRIIMLKRLRPNWDSDYGSDSNNPYRMTTRMTTVVQICPSNPSAGCTCSCFISCRGVGRTRWLLCYEGGGSVANSLVIRSSK